MPSAISNTKGKIARTCELLRRDILQGVYLPGAMLPPHRTLGKRYGVAQATASAAVGRLVHEGLAVTFHGRGSFVSDEVNSSQRIIDLVRPQPPLNRDDRSGELTWMQEFNLACQTENLIARWHHVSGDEACRPDKLAAQLAESNGVIVQGHFSTSLAYALHRQGIPVVALPWSSEPAHVPTLFPQVTFDRTQVGYLAARHMAGLGYERIAFVGISSFSANTRMNGYLRALRELDLPLSVKWMVHAKRGDELDLREELSRVLAQEDRPEAFCCYTDTMARNVVNELLHEGFKIPEDIAVIACDDGVEAVAGPVAITSVGAPIAEICQKAVELISAIEPGFDPESCQLQDAILMPLRLTVRDSCGAKKKGLIN